MIVASDGQQAVTNEAGEITNRQHDKSFIVKKAFVVACINYCNSGCVLLRPDGSQSRMEYSFEAWVVEANKHLPDVGTSLSAVADFMKDKLAGALDEFKSAAQVGCYEPDLPTEEFATHMQIVIAGYDDGKPRVAVVESYFDWEHKRLIGPYVIANEVSKIVAPNFNGYDAFGQTSTFAHVRNQQSYAYKQTMAICPTAFQHFFRQTDITLEETESLLSAFIGVEQQTDPDDVGGPVRFIEITQALGARIMPSHVKSSLPKSASRKQAKTDKQSK